ncbi:MAG: porin [Bacteroides sp.]|nr:porin [Bacteroides sp.]
MKIQNILLAIALLTAGHAVAQDKLNQQVKKDLIQNTTFGGYVIGQATATDQDDVKHSNFDLRLVRLYVDGKVLDVKYKLQMEVNGVSGTSAEKGPRIVDAWAEWQKYKFFQVRFGQFKRAFTFENPMNPWDIGFGSYSQLVTKLAGMSDRLGEHSSGGRDIGLQIQGDLLPIGKDNHNFLHYQVGLYNGQGINHSDVNSRKDLIGGIYVMPIKNLAIGAFGWNGSFSKDNVTVDRKRMAVGVKYEAAWTVRAEYATSKGYKLSDYDAEEGKFSGSDKADAWYMTIGAPLSKKCKLYAKWDAYRDNREWNSLKSIYGLAANYYFYKNLKIQANYNFTYDKSTSKDKHYNTFDLQLYWRF